MGLCAMLLPCSLGSRVMEATSAISYGVEQTEADKTAVVTVVVPCFNRFSLLLEALASVRAQTFHDWQLVVVDDASTEGSAGRVVAGFADPRIVSIRHDRNRGLAAARNTAIRATNSPILALLDADDTLHPAFLEATVLMLEADSRIDCVFTDLRLFGGVAKSWHYGDIDECAMTVGQSAPGAGTVMRRTLWERVGGFCESSDLRLGNEDWDFWLSALECGVTAKHVPGEFYNYRVDGASLSMTLRRSDHQTRQFLYERHRALFDRCGTGPQFLSEGLRRSANAALQEWHVGRALSLGLRALMTSPNKPRTLAALVEGTPAAPVASLLARARARLRSGQH